MKTLHAILIAVCLMLTANIHSVFYLGCRTGISPNNSSWIMADSIFSRVKQANYNNTMTNLTSDNLTTLKDKLNYYGLESVLLDYRTGDNDNPTHWKSASALGQSNYMQFEAEFYNQQSVAGTDQNRDDYWYCSNSDDNNRVGSVLSNSSKSYGHTWSVNPTTCLQDSGYVFSNLKWRWRPDKRIGDQFQFTGMNFMDPVNGSQETALIDFYADKHLYFTFALTVDSLGTEGDTKNLLSFELVGYADNGPGYEYFNHTNIATGTTGERTNLNRGQYDMLPTSEEFFNKHVTISVSLRDLYEAGYLTHRDGNNWKTIMGYVSPRLFWHGKGSLQLDYILIHDSMYDVLQTINVETNNRSNYIAAAKDVVGHFNGTFTNTDTFSEPKHPQFMSFSKIETKIEDEMPTNFPGLFTSLHDSYSDYTKPNGKGFDNPMLFLQQIQPRLFMPNPYHLLGEHDFNSDDETSVQQAFNGLCTKYEDYKYVLQTSTNYSDTKYYICVQTMGYWWGQGSFPNQSDIRYGSGWSWLRPPKETQMAMQFLPLCYGVDGIHDFMFQSYNAPDTLGYWHAVNVQGGSVAVSGAYKGLQAANKKIADYGPLLSSPVTHDPNYSPQLTWRDAITIQESDTPISVFPTSHPAPGILDLGLEGVAVVPASNGYYRGHIQAGLYKDMQSGLPSFMLVNRRANYFNTDPSMRYDNPRYVPPSMLDSFFSPAEPQTVRFYLNQDAHNMVGDHVGLFDPSTKALYTGENNTIDVPIGPGDGILVPQPAL